MNLTKTLPSNRKLQRNNTRTVDLSRGEFQRLVGALNDSLLGMSDFNPKVDKAEKLRKTYEPLYRIVRNYAQVAFQREFDTILMFRISVESLDLVDGLMTIKFTHTVAQKDVVYKLNFRNHLAPYSGQWLKLCEEQETCEAVTGAYELV